MAVVMIAAGIAALAFHRLRLPKVLGYVLAGTVIGPGAGLLPLVHDETTIRTLADLGIVFLMFSLGLEFNLRKLRRVGVTAVVIGILDVCLLTLLGYGAGRALGWTPLQSLFLGAVISDSSTTVLATVLKELGWARERFAPALFGATLVEDVLAIAMIAVLTGLCHGGVDAAALGRQFGVLWAFLVLVTLAGILLVPRLLMSVLRQGQEELLLITVLALCFGVSLLAVQLEFSIALGAFLIGAITAESRLSARIEMLMLPLRQMFTAVFFVAVGLMVKPELLLQNSWLIVGLTLLLLVGKTLACSTGAFLTGLDARSAFRVGLGMAQVCEFALIIGALGQSLGATPPALYQVAVGVCVLSTFLSPLLLRRADVMFELLERLAPERVRRGMHFYSHWLEHAQARNTDNAIHRIVLRCVWIVVLNLACIGGLFMLAAYLSTRWDLTQLPLLAHWPGGNAGIYWLVTVLACLPLYLATALKLRALGMILAELSLPLHARLPWVAQLRALAAGLFFFGGLAMVLLFTFILSAAFLMAWSTLIPALIIVLVVLLTGQQRLLRLYSRAQGALRDNFSRELPTPAPQSFTDTINALLDMEMDTVTVPADSPAAGVVLREFQLRSRTGATIASIERAGVLIPNPEPELALRVNDRVLLMGTLEQLRAARTLLKGHAT